MTIMEHFIVLPWHLSGQAEDKFVTSLSVKTGNLHGMHVQNLSTKITYLEVVM
jgi:hypothetical protein